MTPPRPVPPAGPTVHRIDLPWSVPPLSLNDRLHHQVKAQAVREIRDTVGWLVKAARLPAGRFAVVTLHYQPAHAGRRDPHNLVATLKPAADGLVDAGLVPDDDTEHMHTPTPVIHPPAPGQPARCWLELEITP